MKEREVRADIIACALKGWSESWLDSALNLKLWIVMQDPGRYEFLMNQYVT
jgi:hypothetical protein